jgi:hypothetical protein
VEAGVAVSLAGAALGSFIRRISMGANARLITRRKNRFINRVVILFYGFVG